MLQDLSKSELNSLDFSSYFSFNGGIGSVTAIAGLNPNISAYSNNVIIAVLINILTNKLRVIL